MPFADVDHDDRSASGRPPDAMKPGIYRARTHWIPGFTASEPANSPYYALDPGIHRAGTRWIRGFIAF
jgi:hypothetical protein